MRHVLPILTALLAAIAASAVLAQAQIGFGGDAFDSAQPVEVTSDSLSIDQASGEAVFSGNVIVVQGDLRLATERLQVRYGPGTDGGAGAVEDLQASGGVLVTRGGDAAEGDAARYRVSDGALAMTGDVLITQGGTAIAGDRLVVDLETGIGTVEGRVRTVIDPESAE